MAVQTKVIALSDTRVRVEVEVSEGEIELALARYAEELGQGRMLGFSGFPKSKTPGPMAIEHLGRDRVLGIAVRKELPRWYKEAILRAAVKTVGHPKLDIEELPEAGQPFRFSIEVLVKPKARLGTYKGLKVVRREPEVADELRQAQPGPADEEFREAVVDAAVKAATVELPDELVTAGAEEVWERFELALSDQKTDTKTYLDAAGKTLEQAIDEAKPEAARQLARESVLDAIAEAEGIDIPDEGLRLRKVIDLLAEHAIPIRSEGEGARAAMDAGQEA